MIDIKGNLEQVKETIPDGVTLIAVTKTRGPEEMNVAISTGITDIGENKVQEVLDKYENISPVKWHMIGHLQTNKVKYIIDKVGMIHSVDSLKLAEEINRRAKQHNITMDILIQVNVAEEESKFGISENELESMMEYISTNFENIRICGLMTIAPFEDNPEDVRICFRRAKELFDTYKQRYDFKYLSMGMSHDYRIAIEEGSNMVRVGTAIFGERVYL